MKNVLFASALTLVAASSAFAMAAPVQLPETLKTEIGFLVPGANLDNITNSQYAQIVSLFSNSDNLSAGNNPAGALGAILRQN